MEQLMLYADYLRVNGKQDGNYRVMEGVIGGTWKIKREPSCYVKIIYKELI